MIMVVVLAVSKLDRGQRSEGSGHKSGLPWWRFALSACFYSSFYATVLGFFSDTSVRWQVLVGRGKGIRSVKILNQQSKRFSFGQRCALRLTWSNVRENHHHSGLVGDVAVPVSARQVVLSCAFLNPDARPRLNGRRSASTVLSQVCLGRPRRRFQFLGLCPESTGVILGLVRLSHVAKQLEASGTYYIWQQRLSSASTDFGVCYMLGPRNVQYVFSRPDKPKKRKSSSSSVGYVPPCSFVAELMDRHRCSVNINDYIATAFEVINVTIRWRFVVWQSRVVSELTLLLFTFDYFAVRPSCYFCIILACWCVEVCTDVEFLCQVCLRRRECAIALISACLFACEQDDAKKLRMGFDKIFLVAGLSEQLRRD